MRQIADWLNKHGRVRRHARAMAAADNHRAVSLLGSTPREIYREFRQICPMPANFAPNPLAISVGYSKIPCAMKQGIFPSEPGN